MNVQVAVLCDAATDDNGKLNLLGAFDTLCTRQLPAIQPQCSVALRVTFQVGEEGSRQLKLSFVDADGRSVMPGINIKVDVAFPPDAHFVSRNFIFNLQQLRFDRPGIYAVDISVDDKNAASIPLTVKVLATPPAPSE